MYTCTRCGWATPRRYSHDRHVLTCTVTRFACALNSKCQYYRFEERAILAAHMRVVHGLDPVVAEEFAAAATPALAAIATHTL